MDVAVLFWYFMNYEERAEIYFVFACRLGRVAWHRVGHYVCRESVFGEENVLILRNLPKTVCATIFL